MRDRILWSVIAVPALIGLMAVPWTARGTDETAESEAATEVASLPEAVQGAISAQVGRDEIVGIHRIVGDVTVYEVEWNASDGQHEMLVSVDGEVLELEREVRIDDVPEAARATILRESAGHKVIGVDEITVGDGTFYEAEWLVNEREVEIAVASDGKLIADDGEDDADDHEDDDDDAGDDDDE